MKQKCLFFSSCLYLQLILVHDIVGRGLLSRTWNVLQTSVLFLIVEFPFYVFLRGCLFYSAGYSSH